MGQGLGIAGAKRGRESVEGVTGGAKQRGSIGVCCLHRAIETLDDDCGGGAGDGDEHLARCLALRHDVNFRLFRIHGQVGILRIGLTDCAGRFDGTDDGEQLR